LAEDEHLSNLAEVDKINLQGKGNGNQGAQPMNGRYTVSAVKIRQCWPDIILKIALDPNETFLYI